MVLFVDQGFTQTRKKKNQLCISLLMVTILISLFLFLSALFLFFQTKKHKSQLEQCFQVRKGKVLKEKNDNTGKNKLEKTFANNFKVFLGTNSKKYILSDFEEKKKQLNLLLFFWVWDKLFCEKRKLTGLFFPLFQIEKYYLTSNFFVWESINAWLFLGRI